MKNIPYYAYFSLTVFNRDATNMRYSRKKATDRQIEVSKIAKNEPKQHFMASN